MESGFTKDYSVSYSYFMFKITFGFERLDESKLRSMKLEIVKGEREKIRFLLDCIYVKTRTRNSEVIFSRQMTETQYSSLTAIYDYSST